MTERLPTRVPEVTDRQLEVARLVAAGHTNEGIAQKLGITHDGAKYHVSELLGRLGFERREEIAAWYRAEQGAPLVRGWRRLRALSPLPALVAGGALVAVAAVVLLVVAFEGALGSADGGPPAATRDASEVVVLERGPASEVPIAEYVHHHSGDSWESRAAANLGERELIFLLHGASGRTEIHAIDRSSQERVAEVAVAASFAAAVQSHATGRLIVSHTPVASVNERVLIFNVADGLTLESEFPLPQSPLHGGTAPGWPHRELGQLTLSADERTLYYLASEPGSSNGIGVVDLEGGPREVATVPLPERCATASLTSTGASSVIALCHFIDVNPRLLGPLRVIGPDGSTGPEIAVPDAGFIDHPDFDSLPVSAAAAIQTPHGIGVLYYDGHYAIDQPSGVTMIGPALPQGIAAVYFDWSGDALTLDAVRIVIPYHDEWPVDISTPASGLVVFSTDTATIEQHFRIEHHGSYPLNDHEIALVTNGRVDVLDLTTMRIEQSFNTPHPGAVEEPAFEDAVPAIR